MTFPEHHNWKTTSLFSSVHDIAIKIHNKRIGKSISDKKVAPDCILNFDYTLSLSIERSEKGTDEQKDRVHIDSTARDIVQCWEAVAIETVCLSRTSRFLF
jgi:hypothetical protein